MAKQPDRRHVARLTIRSQFSDRALE